MQGLDESGECLNIVKRVCDHAFQGGESCLYFFQGREGNVFVQFAVPSSNVAQSGNGRCDNRLIAAGEILQAGLLSPDSV